MDKEKLDRIVRKAGLRPERRERFKDYEIYIADGFSLPPHTAHKRFGITPEDFPQGMYSTLWWVSKEEEKLDVGQPIFFDVFHDPEYDPATKKAARINRALKEAQGFLQRRERQD